MLTKISTLISYLQVGWNVLMKVQELVKLIEDEDTEDGIQHGQEKKGTILELISTMYVSTEKFIDIPIEKEFIMSLADNAIDIFVDIFNVLGRFRSKSQTETA